MVNIIPAKHQHAFVNMTAASNLNCSVFRLCKPFFASFLSIALPVSMIFYTPLFLISPSLPSSLSPKKREWDGTKRKLHVYWSVVQPATLRTSTSHKPTIACVCLKVTPHGAIARSCLGPVSPILILQSSTYLLRKIKRAGTDLQLYQRQKSLGLLCICQEQS